MISRQTWISSLLAAGVAALLAGCGGGGGGGGGNSSPTYDGNISGKVVDTSGSVVPSAIVFLDGVAQNATATFQEGGYEVNAVTPGFHVVAVSTTVNGTTYTGATDAAVPNVQANAITNANIIAAPANEQAAVAGYVTDSNGNPVAGARVSFQTAFGAANSLAPNAPASTAAIVAITNSSGYYQLGGEDIGTSTILEPGLPVQQTGSGGTVARSYTITASALPAHGVTYGNAPTVSKQFTASTALITANETNFVLPAASTPTTGTTATPAINYLLAFTQPDIQPYTSQTSAGASVTTAVYEQIRRALAPKYKELEANEHAAAQVKHLVSAAAQPHASSNDYTVEMNLFFSLPGDTPTSLSAVRSGLSGFEIYNNAQANYSPSASVAPYDFLEDPLANYYVDPDLGLGSNVFYYNEDTSYSFEVQSVPNSGVATPGVDVSAAQSVEPLSLVNLSQPADPNDTNGAITNLAADPTFIWSTVDVSQPTVPNNRVESYYVDIYNTFPGVSTTPVYSSPALTPSAYLNASTSAENYTPPGLSLASGEYWVVIAATSNDGTATSSAVSVSQITPFNVP